MRAYNERLKQETVGPRERVAQMKKVNPKYVFRNYLAVQAIEAMEQGDTSVLERLMRVLARPVRRAARARGPRRAPARLGARPRRLLGAVLQLLEAGYFFFAAPLSSCGQ